MRQKLNLAVLSERIDWRILPWRWDEDAPAEWVQFLSIYFNAKHLAAQPQRPMTEEQLAPFKMSRADAEAHLRKIGALQ